MPTPLQLYREAIHNKHYEYNPKQEEVVGILNGIHEQLAKRYKWLKRLPSLPLIRRWLFPRPVQGLYLHGGVGIGKTWLMDLFLQCIPQSFQFRMHFHRFMQQIQDELKQRQGEKNPLVSIAKSIAQKTPVLCFDEFFVKDITDAMLLYGILKALFSEGVTLVTTSNVEPDELYKNGISRENFIPAIKLIQQYTHVRYLTSAKDYRLEIFKKHENFNQHIIAPPEKQIEQFKLRFEKLAGKHYVRHHELMIRGRKINTIEMGHGIVWFNFKDICNIPRSQIDYLDIVQSFHTILLSQVPEISSDDNKYIFYFIYLVDIAYDTQTKLMIGSHIPLEKIYVQGRMKFEYERTKSRLYEMQTERYWQLPHIMRSS